MTPGTPVFLFEHKAEVALQVLNPLWFLHTLWWALKPVVPQSSYSASIYDLPQSSLSAAAWVDPIFLHSHFRHTVCCRTLSHIWQLTGKATLKWSLMYLQMAWDRTVKCIESVVSNSISHKTSYFHFLWYSGVTIATNCFHTFVSELQIAAMWSVPKLLTEF